MLSSRKFFFFTPTNYIKTTHPGIKRYLKFNKLIDFYKNRFLIIFRLTKPILYKILGSQNHIEPLQKSIQVETLPTSCVIWYAHLWLIEIQNPADTNARQTRFPNTLRAAEMKASNQPTRAELGLS